MISIALPGEKKQEDNTQAQKKEWNNNRYIRFRQITTLAPMIQLAREIYAKKTSRRLECKGGRPGVMMLRGVDVDIITKRIDMDQVIKYTLKEKQCGRCSVCYEELEEM